MVTATTFRKIQRDLGAGSESEKVKLRLSVEVEAVDFDPDGRPLTLTVHARFDRSHLLQHLWR